MNILYDHQMFSTQRFGGITKYFCELIRNIPPEHSVRLSILFSDNNYLREDPAFFKKRPYPFPYRNFTGKRYVKKQFVYLNKLYSERALRSNKFDVFHPTFYDTYFFGRLKKPYVITVHDLIEFKFRDTYCKDTSIRPQMEKVITNADRVIAISNNTKKDVIETFGISPDKIDVIYHGYNEPGTAPTTSPFGRYILFVGYREIYKNFRTFVKAAGAILNKEKDMKLICVGTPFSEEEVAIFRKLNITDQVLSMHVSENTLNQLYAHAIVFVYPSLYEGFGMPILEAFANNCPVCLSNTSCFPEIAQDAGVYFDPMDEGSILSAMQRVIYDDKFRSEMIKMGRRHLGNFSWKKTAEETIATYSRLI